MGDSRLLSFESNTLTGSADSFDSSSGASIAVNGTAALLGAFGVDLPSLSNEYGQINYSSRAEVWIAAHIKVRTLPGGVRRVIQVRATTTGTTICALIVSFSGSNVIIRIQDGTTSTGSTQTLATGVGDNIKVGLHYKAGSGANGEIHGYYAVNGASFGAAFAAVTNSTQTASTDSARIGNTTASALDMALDHIVVADYALISSIETRTATCSAALSRAGIARTASATAAVYSTKTRTATTTAAISRPGIARTAATSVAVSRANNLRTATSSAALQSTLTRTAATTAALSRTLTRTAGTTAAISSQNFRTAGTTAALSSGVTARVTWAEMEVPGTAVILTRTATATAAIQQTLSRTGVVTAAVSSTLTRTAATTAAIQKTLTRTAASSAALDSEGLNRSATTSAALSEAEVTLDAPATAALYTVGTRTTGATAAIYATLSRTAATTLAVSRANNTRTATASAAVRQTLTRIAGVTAALNQPSRSAPVTAALSSPGLIRTATTSAALNRTPTRTAAVTAALSRVNTRTSPVTAAVGTPIPSITQVTGRDDHILTATGRDDSALTVRGNEDMPVTTHLTFYIGSDQIVRMTIDETDTDIGSIAGRTFRGIIADKTTGYSREVIPSSNAAVTIQDANARIVDWTIEDTDWPAHQKPGTSYSWAIWRADDDSDVPLGEGPATLVRLPGS